MWFKIAGIILRNRITLLIALVAVTGAIAYQSKDVRMSYKFKGLLPANDSANIAYEKFKEKFPEDGNILAIGVQGEELYELEHFQAWYDLGKDLTKITVRKKSDNSKLIAVDSVLSVTNLYTLVKNKAEKKFDFEKVVKARPTTQTEVDSLKNIIESLPIYRNLLYNDTSNVSVMIVFVNINIFNSKDRGDAVAQIQKRVEEFEAKHIKAHYSGLPYIRTHLTQMVKDELWFFTLLAGLVTALLLYLFFRSLKVVLTALLVVGIGVAWSLGFIGIFNYPLTMLMGLIPPLIIVIGIPNCIFLINKYQSEYKDHGNKIRALSRVIQKIGNATFMTNVTTAMGFATFIFTHSDVLKHFGVIASINIIGVFIISILIIPIVFSFLPPPKERHTRHLDKKWLDFSVSQLVNIVKNHRRKVYIVTALLIVAGGYGLTKMVTTGNIVDDLPQDNFVMTDLHFFEEHFNGVLPFEIIIDTKKEGQIFKKKNLKKIDKLQRLIAEYPQFSRSLSIVDALKFARQAFYNGNPNKYALYDSFDQSSFLPYLKEKKYGEGISLGYAFVDSLRQTTRVTAPVADIGTLEMEKLINELRPKVDEIFPPEKYDVQFTGTSVVYLKGTTYMVKNLFISLCIAIFIIACIMALLFRSLRMVFVSLLPNLIPLLVTAAIMGYFGIPLKPSTILVFSIAFGISVDDTIHYLAKYRLELKSNRWNIKKAAINAVRETGVSMIYTSIILFFGFGMFSLSTFGGTVALGILVSVTLLVAMFTNLILLPSLLLSLENSLTTKSFKEEPLLEIFEVEDDDLELKDIQLDKK